MLENWSAREKVDVENVAARALLHHFRLNETRPIHCIVGLHTRHNPKENERERERVSE